ncbi:Protein of unknown function [Cotesia congregata]|uniref:Uncharacterized protein n=1 Tax=Cotesia congregata TaxID=51543 RepID=A0A8J2HGC3_COTCN|nr:Protein of unknown function [Cotesia congregata]
MGRKFKSRSIPEQDRRICGGICFCQFTIVISCVSLVYLTVAIYMPSHRAFNAGIDPEPVMCQTVNATLVNYCAWASCGEWCLTKTTGFCPQIHATVRRNGTDLILENCTKFATVSCPQVNLLKLKRYNCNNGSECGSLTGVFNCSLGHCANMSELVLCHHKADGIIVDSEKDNMKLNGFFDCQNSRCTKIKRPFSCDRYCPRINSNNVNVYLMQDDSIITARCSRALALNKANGNLLGTRLDSPVKIWEDSLGKPVDPTNAYLPSQRSLTIYNTSRLYINLEGCVNTLRGECRDFLQTHGRDGDNQTAQSRYPCFHKRNDSSFVVARFDLNKTRTELLIATIVPSVLFIISFLTLVIITRSVQVGDDTKMRCRYCTERQVREGEDEGLVQASSGSTTQANSTATEIRSMAL